MSTFQIKKGLDIQLEGNAEERIETYTPAKTIALQPQDLPYHIWRVVAQEGETVQVGSPILASKSLPSVVLTSTVSGTVKSIVRGARRSLQRVVIESDGQDNAIDFGTWASEKVNQTPVEELEEHLQKGGLWPLIRQRPFNKIAVPGTRPKAIFLNGMSTAPLAAKQRILCQDRLELIQAGIEALRRFCSTVHAISMPGDSTFANLQGVHHHSFEGPHPAGLPSTHIAHIAPISKGDIVWTLTMEQTALIGEFLRTGKTPNRTVLAVAGSKSLRKQYFTVTRHSCVADFAEISQENSRVISGDVLNGTTMGKEGYVGFYDNLVSCIPEGAKHHYFGQDRHWNGLGLNVFSTFPLFLSKLKGRKRWNLDTNLNGGQRAIILSENYERFVPLDIEVTFLIKAILAGDIDEMEALGLLEIDPEDVSLCTFACPSKVEISEIVRQGLALVEKDG